VDALKKGTEMNHAIRVAVAHPPRFMRELLLEVIVAQPDLEVVAEIDAEEEIMSVVDGTHPDFLVMTINECSKRPEICDILLRRYPEMKILALDPERNCSTFYWASFDIHSSSVEASESGLLGALRSRPKLEASSELENKRGRGHELENQKV
jgi:hypothetical protein